MPAPNDIPFKAVAQPLLPRLNALFPIRSTVLLSACVLNAVPSGAIAQDLNRLELGTHDLAEMKTLGGVTLVFDPTKIVMVYVLPRSNGRSGFVTHIVGLAGGAQEIEEPAESFLERLHLKPYFVALTLPDGAPLLIKASAISFFRATYPWDNTRVEAKSAVNAGGRPIFVKENVAAIKDAINAIRRQNASGARPNHMP